nr:HAD family hydrolase [Taibaiella koreensis]
MIRTLEALPHVGLCYATGSLRQPAVYKLEQSGIGFDPLQLSASNNIEEREQIVLQAIAQAKVFFRQDHFERIIAVGDGLWDLAAARNLGLEFIGVGRQHRELLLSQGAGLHLDSWMEFDPACLAQPLILS